MVTPYYKDERVTIYHGDCREILPTLPDNSVDLVLTDPPYMNLKGGMKLGKSPTSVADVIRPIETMGNKWNATLDWVPLSIKVCNLGIMAFCSFAWVGELQLALPREGIKGLAVWYDRKAMPAIRNVPRYTTQFIWLWEKNTGLKWRQLGLLLDVCGLPAGCMATERILNRDGSTAHPTQKPIELIKRLLCVGGEIILDPFLGSGTTAFAAKQLNRHCIGIEIEEKYCEIAANRCRQMVMDLI